jgi:hypothetical protein
MGVWSIEDLVRKFTYYAGIISPFLPPVRPCDDCANPKRNFNITFNENKVGDLLSNLYFTDKELVEIDARTTTDIAIFEEKRTVNLEVNEGQKKKIREKLKFLHTNKLDLLIAGTYSAESYLEEENRLHGELTKLQGEEQTSDEAMHEVIKDIVKISELLKDNAAYWSFANSHEKEQIMRVIFSELSLSENTLQFKVKKGFVSFQTRLLVDGDHSAWLSELTGVKDYTKFVIQELSALITK